MGAAPDCSGGAHMDEGEGLDLASGPRCWPPGVRFHPTDEELVLYYLKRKICGRRIRPCMIGDVDVYKLDPWELPEKSVLRSGEKQWYFFSPRDRKYPNGSRSNRASKHGYWKATGKDRTIMQNSRPAGNKKTLVYYHGRAPKGERTNWVMHEYTLDEQMLMSCTTVQDSFALYKLFRKSGAGPKNGEQYGAPFKEEEWVDDDDDAQDECLGNQINKEDTSNEHLVNQSADRALTVNLEQNTNEFEVLLLQMSRELDATPGDLNKFSSFAPESCPDLEGARDIVNPPTYLDTGFPHYNSVWCEQGSEMASLETAVSPSVGYALLSLETPESVPLTNCSMQAQLEGIEEFLEIKDFNDLASVALSTDDNIVTDDHIHVNNGEVDADDYFDAQMFLAEAMGPIDEISPHSYWDGSNFIETQFETSDLTTELWTHEQVTNTQTAAQSNQIGLASSASSGLLYGSGSQSDHVGDIQGNINNAPNPSDSWFASALSAFLDAVPSSPALASENALINRALTRVSSFRAVQNQRNGGHVRRQGGQNGGFLFVSFLVGLGAIVWFLIIGVAMKVFKGFWGRFISS